MYFQNEYILLLGVKILVKRTLVRLDAVPIWTAAHEAADRVVAFARAAQLRNLRNNPIYCRPTQQHGQSTIPLFSSFLFIKQSTYLFVSLYKLSRKR